MSLTSIITGKGRGDKKLVSMLKIAAPLPTAFHTDNGMPAFDAYPVVVPNNLKDQRRTRMLGRMFDWYARIIVASSVKKNKDQVFDALKTYLPVPYSPEEFEKAKPIERKMMNLTNDMLFRAWDEIKNHALKVEHFVFGQPCEIGDVVRAVHHFALAEERMRTGKFEQNFEFTEDMDEEMFAMIRLFNDTFLKKYVKPESVAFFNPSFGAGSALVNGADADLIIDGMLVDFKTTQFTAASNADILQIVGYAALNHIYEDGDIVAKEQPQYGISAIALYKARFGVLECCPLDKLRNTPYNTAKTIARLFR